MGLHGARFGRINTLWSKFRVYGTSISGSGNFLEIAKEEHLKIAEKIGYKKSSKFIRTLLWVITRISDPQTSFQRILDGIKSGKRIIPS